MRHVMIALVVSLMGSSLTQAADPQVEACLEVLKGQARMIDVAFLGKVTKAKSAGNVDVCELQVMEVIKGPADLKTAKGAFFNRGTFGPPAPGAEGLWILARPDPRTGIRQPVYRVEKPSAELVKAVKEHLKK